MRRIAVLGYGLPASRGRTSPDESIPPGTAASAATRSPDRRSACRRAPPRSRPRSASRRTSRRAISASAAAVNAPSASLPSARAAFAERDAEREVARLRRRAGEDQVAEARKAGQRLAARAEARPKRASSAKPRVTSAAVALAPSLRPCDDAGRDREHVLCRAADLDAAHVGCVIGPERLRAERAGERVRRSPHRRRRA